MQLQELDCYRVQFEIVCRNWKIMLLRMFPLGYIVILIIIVYLAPEVVSGLIMRVGVGLG